jgi:two-component system response regulator AtoC
MGKTKIFIVEDDTFYSKMINHKLSMDPEFEISIFHDGESFLDRLHERPTIITLDHSLPDISGLELLKKIKQEFSDIPVIVLSSQELIVTALEMLQFGAYDYIIKDSAAMDKLWHIVHQANEKQNLFKEIEILSSGIANQYNFQKYLKGSSDPMKKVHLLLEKTTKTNITVTITGETGTGKELAAKSVHYNSDRIKKPFVAINVAAIPKELIESELFGYEKGAFTGADNMKFGKFEEANNGTLFLDEIGEMDLNMQAKLLRVLQEKEISRLGSNKIIPLNIRIIVATHRNLSDEVKNGRFREDLFYRLLGVNIELPPLRERGNDIILLAKYFVDEFCKDNNIQKKEFSSDAVSKLMTYRYPGNVRELKAISEISVVMSDGDQILENDIEFNKKNDIEDFLEDDLTLDQYNGRIIKWFLNKYNNNVIQVAEKLEIGKSTIYRMIKEGKI